MQVINGIEWSIQGIEQRFESGWVEWNLLGYDSEGREYTASGQGFEQEGDIIEVDHIEETGNYIAIS